MADSIWVSVPATTANIGPGFDCLGAALSRYNRFGFDPATETDLTIQVSGAERDRVTTDRSNLVYQAFCQLFERLQQPVPPVRIAIELGVPLARGLGSSSTAIVGGLLGANAWAGAPFSTAELAAIATEIEGHPDNVVPALLGGCQLATTDDQGQITLCPLAWHDSIVPVVAIPAFEVSTAEARRVLPQQYDRADVISNVGHLGLLLRALATGNGDWLRTALGDRIHVPYRQTLIPGYDAVGAAAISAGAYGVTISGAGPTLLALADADHAATVAEAMAQAWTQAGITVVAAEALTIDSQGATIA
ncbi:MAG: homoserine kinase [Cyanobacteria bacterium]|nr:homoserine kinase [Cyanobacteriota bacterium]MDA0865834.1 homoserine kinase [Cyanobacteriota bacterium]